MSEFWSACLSSFQQELPVQQFNTWIRSLRLENETGAPDHLRLLAPNRFVLQWVRERYLGKIENLSRQFFSSPVIISLALDESAVAIDKTSGEIEDGLPVEDMLAEIPQTSLPVSRTTNPAYEKARLNPEFSFDTLVTGRSNDLARAAAQQVALNPGTSYNPLFVYGGVGLGKTHLVHALGNEVWRNNPDRIVRYVHAHDYIADVVRAYQQKAFDNFKRYYCSLDLLIIDDIQFLNGKDRTQEEFFFAFNALIESKKQIVITCDTYPKDIQGLENRLISRFDWGLTVQVEPPELEMRVAILKKKAEVTQVHLGDDVAFLIAKNLRSNVRELEGALNRVIAYARFHGRDINMEVAKEALKDVIGAHNRQITLELIQKYVADYFKIKVSEMYSQKRTRAIARPRQIAMWLARELTPHSLPEIGDAFGGRDHTTVLHACRTIIDLRTKDGQLNNDLHVLLQTIKG
ncbi:MAG: chromosomal replication initiator protein DnaA [Candidatus Nitricoxidivorans perseverans]|uniref:Chromosomal replication initiator protein DnaA n=1 Tax=Candidatus Nitricoxidivorans perseverans TaxID=2975601 RepID=A0AA49FJL3_9PROT|nr:MAG: chromosomal replication initiator protein DnaA [Candidatus Nitricoxidivorans perseverans]